MNAVYGKKKKSPVATIEKFYGIILALFIGYCIADLTILNVRDLMLPNQAPPARPKRQNFELAPSRSSYNTIASRNIFSIQGTIPDELIAEGQERQKEEVPVLSGLPLNLIGTIVHSNPAKSIATIEIKSKNLTLSFSPEKEIENIANVIKIERGKVIIRNLNNSRLEFLEMKTGAKLNFGVSQTAEPSGDVKQIAKNKFEVNKTDLQKHLSDLPNLLQQARTVPHRNPSTGEIDGFTLLDFQPDSVFSQLGLQKMDILKGVNGEDITTPAKAMELFNTLKGAKSITVEFERNGKKEKNSYTIK